MSVAALAGSSRDEAAAALGAPIEGDLRLALRRALDRQAQAFAAPGALDATVHHPMLDMTGADLLGHRVVDLTVHAWDLARSLGGDEHLDPSLVAFAWESLRPIAPVIGQIGVFGTGPSGQVGDDAPLAQRLLDLTGRRP